MRYCVSRLSKIILLSLLVVVIMPSIAFAGGDVFDIIQAKMVSTVRDVRKIVYVVAGFGLVMFSVLAIFNKISFKHLAYIMISLSLLALMTPFINYFGGNLEENDLDYGSFISEDNAQGGSPGYNNNACEQTNTCPSDKDPTKQGTESDPNSPGATGDENGEGGEGDEGGEGGNRSNMDPLEPLPGIDMPGAEVQGETGGLAIPPPLATPEEEKKSLKERAQNFINGVGNFIDNVGNTLDAIEHGKNAVTGAIAGAQDVGAILKGDGNFFDKLRDVSNSIGNTTAGVGSSIHGALGNSSEVADYLGMEGTSDRLDGWSDRVGNSQGNINDWTGMGNDVGGLADDAGYQWGRITGGR